MIDCRNRAPTGARLDHVDDRHFQGQSAALLEQVNTRDFEFRRSHRFAMVDQAGLRRRAPHVEGEKVVQIEFFRQMAGDHCTGGRPRFDHSDGIASGHLGADDTAVGHHDEQWTLESCVGEALLKSV